MEESTEIPLTEIPQIKVEETPANCPVPPACPVCPPKKKLSQVCLKIVLLLIVGSIIAFLLLVSSGIVIVRKESLLDVLLNKSTPTPIPTAVIEPTPTPDPTVDWITYTNALGYSIKYPASFTTGLQSAGAGNKEADPTTRNLFIYKSDAIDSYIERYVNLEIFQIKPVYDQQMITQATLDNRTVEKVVFPDAKFDTYSVQANDKGFIEISISNDPAKKEIANQILSTFKFLPTASPTASPSSVKPVSLKSISLATATGPLVIKGTVEPGWMFEGLFPVTLLDDKRLEIATGSGKEVTPGSWQSGKPVEFSVSLTFSTKATSGFLIFKKDNPSGLPENEKSFELPVKFAQR